MVHLNPQMGQIGAYFGHQMVDRESALAPTTPLGHVASAPSCRQGGADVAQISAGIQPSGMASMVSPNASR